MFVVNGDVLPGRTPPEEPRSALYRNLGGFVFEDVTEKAGLSLRAFAHGATAVDFNADGHTDLYVTVFLGPNRFFRNRGDGTFEDSTAAWGGADAGPSTGAAFFDADGDGDLDLYVANYVVWEPERAGEQASPCRWRGIEVVCGPRGMTPAADTFWDNRDGKLVRAEASFGFDTVTPAYALGVVSGDFDNDGDTDVYVANDSEPNYLFENLGAGRFRESGTERGVARNEDGRAQAGMGVDFGDIDNDGRFDYFVTNFSHDSDTLYHNVATADGRTLFEDLTHTAKLGLPTFRPLAWGTGIVDLDLDGWQDLVVACGHVYPEVTEETVGTSYAQRSQVFFNEGPSAAAPVTFRLHEPTPDDAFAREALHRGLMLADLDDDGDSDLLFVVLHGKPILVRNDVPREGHHWIGFRLRGTGANVDAIGARIEVEDAARVRRWRERVSGSSYLSSNDPRIVVGLGASAGPVRVTVRWPHGARQVFEGLQSGRYWPLEAEPR